MQLDIIYARLYYRRLVLKRRTSIAKSDRQYADITKKARSGGRRPK